MEKTIRIFGKEKTVGEGDKKQKFISFSYTKDGKVFYQVKFNQTCDNVPKTEGYWLITLDSEDVSIKKVKPNENGFKNNDILWIANISKKVKDTVYEEEVAKRKRQEVEDVL